MLKREVNWQVFVAVSLIAASVVIYAIHYAVFEDSEHLLKYGLHELAFVFIEVLLVTMIIHRVLEMREKKARLEKLNMVIETFFSEVGTRLLAFMSDLDPNLDSIRKELVVTDKWSDAQFAALSGRLRAYSYGVTVDTDKLVELRGFMVAKRDFLVRLLENPMLLEHESFTELLRAVFHMTEELSARDSMGDLPDSDRSHLAGDIKRAYGHLAGEWLDYMKYLKASYPYLFSFAMRSNPFDRTASPLVG